MTDRERLPIRPDVLTQISVDEYTLVLSFACGGLLQISGMACLHHGKGEAIVIDFGAKDFRFACGALIGKKANGWIINERTLIIDFSDDYMLEITNPKRIPEAAFLHFDEYVERFVG